MIGSGNSSLSLGLSSCPNDTFVFYALLHEKVSLSMGLRPYMADVEQLNRSVLSRSLDVSKVSFAVYGHVLDDYVLLRSGSALGRSCGPLIVTREADGGVALEDAVVAVPGEYTTAALLLRLYCPGVGGVSPMNFSRIPHAVASGEVEAGVIIHETRFTYRSLGLRCLQDLGTWWEEQTGLPIPLGGVIARRSLGGHVLQALDEALRSSVRYAMSKPEAPMDFVRSHAQELSDEVMKKHIDLYVNRHTVDLGEDGIDAVDHLLKSGHENGVFPKGTALREELAVPRW
jgi:1,4-dihydroxy-6-naphthoate synthase